MLAIFGVLIFLPFAGFVSLCIRVEDGGPIFFRQGRLGLNRRSFDVLKFRTMRDGVVTKVGVWLRRTGLDEVAQFANVLNGTMSMVGPRPLTLADAERLGWTGQRHERRFTVTPGITGIAQLFGGRSARQSYRLDMLYQRRASAVLDLWLVFWSFLANLLTKTRVRRLHTACRGLRRHLKRSWKSARVGRRRTQSAMTAAPRLPAHDPTATPEPGLVLLINPFYPKDPTASYGKHVLAPTLALTSIAGATPAQWHVEYWDENLLQGAPPTRRLPEVVGITVHLTFAARAYELARWYRACGSKVILGGLHVTSCPSEAEPHADAIAIGDGVVLWPKILDDLGRGQLQKIYRAGFNGDLRSAPMPARQILPKESFLTTASINATRGCHNRCGFCYLATPGLNMPYRTRGVDRVVAEIESANEPYVVFTDNNLGSDLAYLRELVAALKPLEIIWSAAVTIDITDDPDLVHAMALSGCTGVFIGFETLSDENLAQAKKRTPRTEDYRRRVQILHDNGIQVNGSFVFGFDDDRPDVFDKTVDWIEANKLESATFHILTPYPGTPFFRTLESQGRLLHKDWTRYDTGHVVFQPKHMSPEDLHQGYGAAYRRLFSHRSIWRRRPTDLTAVPSYLAMAYLYKKSNWLWRFLIAHRLTRTIWTPLVELSRRRHLKFRRRLQDRFVARERLSPDETAIRAKTIVSAGV
ncbi:MAG: sugar transferase [Deltaproteobacteria bacterium]|nr:sugar transferase [Deltaproteobacteria bacterium]